MNAAQVLFHQPWVARLGWTLLHFLWEGTLIAALLAVWRGLPGRSPNPRLRYAAGCVALAAMLLVPLVTFLALLAPGAGTSPGLLDSNVPVVPGVDGAPASLPLSDLWEAASPWLGAAWLLGVALCSLRLFGGWLVTARLRSAQARPVPAEWQPKLEHLMARVGVTLPVRLLASALVEIPAVIGWLRPVILVPVGALAGLPAGHVEALLAHELAHIRRHDYLVNLLQSAAEALLFYHPAVWWVSRQIRMEREHCCDDLAIAATGGDVLAYAHALAGLELCRPVHAHAMAASGGSLRNRIRRLADRSRPASHAAPAGGVAWVLSLLLAIGIAAAAVRGSESPAAPPQEAAVDQKTIWPDTVKQGDVKIQVRGLGTLTSATVVEVKLASKQAVDVVAGQPVEIGFERRIENVAGRVQKVRPGTVNGLVTADVTVLAPLPQGVNVGERVDATVTITRIFNVVYVGRPVFGTANSEATLFKFDPDGQHATRVKVQFGRTSVNQIEIKSGLQPGDQVILNDMRAYEKYDRIAVK